MKMLGELMAPFYPVLSDETPVITPKQHNNPAELGVTKQVWSHLIVQTIQSSIKIMGFTQTLDCSNPN